MPSYVKAKTSAERSASYRERRGPDVRIRKRGEKNRDVSKFDRAKFIAIDGEGESYGPLERFEVGVDGAVYEAQDHRYTFLAASTGEYLYRNGERLGSQTCIDFLLDLSDGNKKAIFVIFAGGYDVNHMLLFGFDKEVLKQITAGEVYEYQYQDVDYRLEYWSRKSFSLKRGKLFKNGKFIWQSSIIIWDVWGFFQDSFVGVMKKWLGEEWKYFDLIQRMKLRRGDFENISHAQVIEYNNAELETLVEIMRKVRDALAGLDLKVRRWDGAGAVAAAMFKLHETKKFKNNTSEALLTAVRCAYAGGRIEICKVGTHHDKVYDYDINSAYPAAMFTLPCLACGSWRYGTGTPPSGFTLILARYDFQEDLPFYPLFFRTDSMSILFPSEGRGWYWWPEYEAALEHPGFIEAEEWYHYEPACNHRPFRWIEEYYRTRQQWVKNPLEEWQGGGEKIIKLGLNSLYGKTAQQLGGDIDNPPPYHQMEWAGYITSMTRARLYKAAMTDPDSVIGFATDGIFTTKPLDIPISDRKEFAAWELKQPEPVGMTIAQAGVYWWHYDDGKYNHFSRGFDKEAMLTPENVIAAWKEGRTELAIPLRRLIGMGSACMSNSFWQMRGRFTFSTRKLKLNGSSSKREPIDVKRCKPHKQLVNLQPKPNVEYQNGQELSEPYPLKWMVEEIESDDEYMKELEMIRENGDTENI